MINVDELEQRYPVLGKGCARMRHVLYKKEFIEEKLSIDSRCPVDIWVFNFRPKIGNGKSKNKACCSILLLGYKEGKGKFEVGEIIEEVLCHNLMEERTTNYNPFAAHHQRKKAIQSSLKKKIGKREINKICINEELEYRPFSIQKIENGKSKIIFWHPEFGYSSLTKPTWLNVKKGKRSDPFKTHKLNKQIINKAKLIIFENGLDKVYQVLDEPVIYGNNTDKRIAIFCKLHGHKTTTPLHTIERGLWFNCKYCSTNTFWNKNSLSKLRKHPSLDCGQMVVYLISASVQKIKTLKFGVAKVGPVSRTDEEAIQARYSSDVLRNIQILSHHRCSTELAARELEYQMLLDTLDLRNINIKQGTNGYTECRVYSEYSASYCEKTFALVLHSYFQNN